MLRNGEIQDSEDIMSDYVCEDCDTPYTSPKAALLCCDETDEYGYPVWRRGDDWLP